MTTRKTSTSPLHLITHNLKATSKTALLLLTCGLSIFIFPPNHPLLNSNANTNTNDQAQTSETELAQDQSQSNPLSVRTRRRTRRQAKGQEGLKEEMGLSYNVYLSSPKIYACKNCKAHLSNPDHIISRSFRGQHGKAYLFSEVVNITYGTPSERNMTTGRHVVRDIACRQCSETVGWTYDKAFEPTEKYKEGKFILEAELLCNVS